MSFLKTGISDPKSFRAGIIGIVTACGSAGMSVPLVNEYPAFRPEMLLIVRAFGVLCGVLIILKVTKSGWKMDWSAVWGGLVWAIASVTFFKAVRLWGANPVITVLTITPIVNFIFAVVRGREFPWLAIFSLTIMFAGVICALQPWTEGIHVSGLLWTLVAVVTAGLGFECLGMSKATRPVKFLWYGLFTIVLSILTIVVEDGKFILVPDGVTWQQALYVYLILGSLGGVAYLWGVTVALERMPVTTASVLLQAETPAVIIGSFLLVGKHLSVLQWFGVFVAIVGASYLIFKTNEMSEKKSEPPA